MTTTTTLLSRAEFVGGLTTDAAGNVYRLVHSYTNGTALVEHIGTVDGISDADYATLASDDRARCALLP